MNYGFLTEESHKVFRCSFIVGSISIDEIPYFLKKTVRYAMFLRVLVNKVNLLPERIMPGLTGVYCSETEV